MKRPRVQIRIDENNQRWLVCCRCGTEKKLEDFAKSQTTMLGYKQPCKKCQSACVMKSRKAHPETAWRITHPEEAKASARASTRKWREAHPEKANAWGKTHPKERRIHARNRREKHLEEIRAQDRLNHAKHRATDPERHRANVRRSSKKHREKISERERVIERIQQTAYKRQWRHLNPELVASYRASRRAREKNAPNNDLTPAQWREIKEIHGHKCVYCGRKMKRLTQDHITPLSKGGSHTASNVLPACHSCNSKKGTGTVLIPVQPLLLTMALPKEPFPENRVS